MLIVDIDFVHAEGLRERELKQNFHFSFPSKVKSAAFGSSQNTQSRYIYTRLYIIYRVD